MEFNKENIIELADRYPYITGDVAVEKEVKHWLETNRYLNKEIFLRLCCWKSQKPKRHYIKNEEQKIIKITKIAFSTNNEKEKIEALMTLYGVGYPVASAILHFAFPDKYPIMDFRVIESLGWEKPNYYSFKFWEKYCNKIRELSEQYGVSIRTIDKALWTYSKENKSNSKKLDTDSELELNGNFSFSKFDYLSTDELDIVECFLKAHGNFKTVQLELGMSYPVVKKKYNDILEKLNRLTLKAVEKEGAAMLTANAQPINETDSLVIKKIKEKLNDSGGRAIITLYSGDSCDIGYDTNDKGLISSKIPPENQLTWRAFNAAVEIVINNGGKAIKGNARSGAKLGSEGLPLDSIEGYIAHKVHGVQIGETAFGPGFVIAAVLDWVEICHNERGYLTINNKFMAEYKG